MPTPFRHVAVLSFAVVAGLACAPAQAENGIAGAFLAAKVAAANADYRAADIWYQRALSLDPSNISLVQGAMIAALSLGDLARAAGYAKELTARGVADQNADLAILAHAAQTKDYAAILDRRLQGASAGSMQSDLLSGWAHIGLGQMNDGIARFDNVQAQAGLEGFALYHKAIALALAGNFDGAAAALGAPEAEPLRRSRRGAVLYAEILSQIGKGAEAAAILRQGLGASEDRLIAARLAQLTSGQALPISGFVDASSGLAEAFYSVASALGAQTDPAYRLLHARIASVLRPDDGEAQLLTAQVLETLGQNDLAAQTYARVAPDDPDFIFAETGRADAVFAAGRAEESLKILQDLAGQFAQNYDAQLALGHGLRRAEQFGPAVQAYDAAAALVDVKTTAAWPLFYSRGIALESLGEFDRAEADFRAALNLSPNQPNVLNYLGYSLVDRGQKLDEALDMIQRAVALRPDSGYIVDSLAWAYFRLNRFAEALPIMERAAQLEPVDPIVTDHLGDVYWANGRKREAVFQWRRALSFDPTEKDAARIRQKLELGLDAVRAAEGGSPFPAQDQGGL
ncbi:MAG: tetratricopeptide repeat protein [Cypionkella sp.]|nr:tetratricopeptide repeat protein [Cypionkella sp.]